MTATSCTAIEALKALRLGSKVRCVVWAEGRYIEVVADKITLDNKEAHILTQNSIFQDFVLCDGWEILDY
jgi:hypothetical protein